MRVDDGLAIFLLTFELALVTTLLLLCLGTPLAWWLANTTSRLKPTIMALVMLPLVVPPTVLGFYLLILLGPQGWVGQFMLAMGLDTLTFSFTGLVVASLVYSLPFMVQPLKTAFESVIRSRLLDAAATLSAGPLDRFFSVVVPMCRGGFLTAMVLVFAHTLGEFGVALMIGGNIPGETRVVSIAIYDLVESQQYERAHLMAGSMLLISFLMMFVLYRLIYSPGKPS